MAPADDPIARLHGRASFFDALQSFWSTQSPPKTIHANPRIGGKELDLYIFFEAVRGLGGLQLVSENRQLAMLRDLLQLPETANNYAHQLRSNYERYCAPCENYLIRAVDRTYRETRLYCPTHDWLRARIDFSDSAAPAPRHDPSRPVNPEVAIEMKEQQDFLSHPEATQAAIRARLRVDCLEASELNHCLFTGNESHMVHVDIRNHILRMWYRQTQRRLDVYTALMDVPQRFHELGCRVFSFLECTGSINFGAIPLMTPVALRRAQSQEQRNKVAIVGAGISGLIAARQLRSFGISVTVFEARNRPGGRIRTEKGMFSTGVDMGAMLITGIVQNPVAVLAHQTHSPLHFLDSDCPLFDIDGTWVSKEADTWAEREYNAILDATARYRKRASSERKAERMSLGEAFQKSLVKRVARRKARIKKRMQSQRKAIVNEWEPLHEEAMRKLRDEDFLEILPTSRGKIAISSKVGENAAARSNQLTSSSSSGGQSGLLSDNQRRNGTTVSCSNPRTRRVKGETSKPFPQDCNKNEGSKKHLSHGAPPKDEKLISRLLRWHIANLEYACASEISKVSLMHWDQDDPYGFQGEHVLLKSGYEPLLAGLVSGIERNMRYGTKIVSVSYSKESDRVRIGAQPKDGIAQDFTFDAVLITVPLGVLKQGSIRFRPPLPAAKLGAISRLGAGGLMKVAMEFTQQFWVDKDMFGALRESVEKRGEFYFFWNLVPCTGKLILVAVVAEPSVGAMETRPDKEIVEEAMTVLRRCYPTAPDPIAFAVSRWSKDCFARGAYTNIPVGSSGEDYDVLASPVGRVFFAGEHTCRMNPTTCASGVISGLREACRILDKLDVVPTIAQIHSDLLKEVLVSRGEKLDLEDGAGLLSATPSKRVKLSVEPVTPQSPPGNPQSPKNCSSEPRTV